MGGPRHASSKNHSLEKSMKFDHDDYNAEPVSVTTILAGGASCVPAMIGCQLEAS